MQSILNIGLGCGPFENIFSYLDERDQEALSLVNKRSFSHAFSKKQYNPLDIKDVYHKAYQEGQSSSESILTSFLSGFFYGKSTSYKFTKKVEKIANDVGVLTSIFSKVILLKEYKENIILLSLNCFVNYKMGFVSSSIFNGVYTINLETMNKTMPLDSSFLWNFAILGAYTIATNMALVAIQDKKLQETFSQNSTVKKITKYLIGTTYGVHRGAKWLITHKAKKALQFYSMQ